MIAHASATFEKGDCSAEGGERKQEKRHKIICELSKDAEFLQKAAASLGSAAGHIAFRAATVAPRHRRASGAWKASVSRRGSTHEGQLHFNKAHMTERRTQTPPETVTIFPIHPDTPTFRYTNAFYRDLHRKVDREIGDFLSQLEADGVMDDTIIFYYGDHGGVLPGSKGYAYERGLHVPLVVYAPDKWKHLLPAERGSRVDGFVEFVDLGPTVLKLAGLKAPPRIDGKAFLGESVQLEELDRRNTAFGYADRFDEKYDMVRTLRVGNMIGSEMVLYRPWLNLHFQQPSLHIVSDQIPEDRIRKRLRKALSPFDLKSLYASQLRLLSIPLVATHTQLLNFRFNSLSAALRVHLDDLKIYGSVSADGNG